jgi:glycine/serine hydroxymethyltransferase
MREGEMEAIGDWIADILDRIDDENVQKRVKKAVEELCERFPLYPK